MQKSKLARQWILVLMVAAAVVLSGSLGLGVMKAKAAVSRADASGNIESPKSGDTSGDAENPETKTEPSEPDQSDALIVGLGDSITTGYGLEEEGQCYLNLAAKELNAKPANYAVNGQTTAQLKKQLKKAVDGKKAAADLAGDLKQANYVVLTIGGNDLVNTLVKEAVKQSGSTQEQMKKWLVEPQENYDNIAVLLNGIQKASEKLAKGGADKTITTAKKNLKTCVSYVRKLNKSAVIMVATQYNPYLTLSDNVLLSPMVKNLDSCVKKYNKAVKAVVTGKNCKVLEAYKTFKNAKTSMTNVSMDASNMNLDFHPNGSGHEALAKLVCKAAKK